MGLNNSQGVIIPSQNVKHLVLKEDVLDAIENNKFKIWAVNTIDEGIEILTGVKAGNATDGGDFEKDTVKYFVNKRLKEISGKLREFSLPMDGKAASKELVN